MIQYSSNEGDLVGDFFLGGFSTAKVAIGLNRRAIGFEISNLIYDTKVKEMESIIPGYLLPKLRTPIIKETKNLGQHWTDQDCAKLAERFNALIVSGKNKKQVIAELGDEFGRGRFSIAKALEKMNNISPLTTKPKKKELKKKDNIVTSSNFSDK
jgi:site-specific DNA-methyltransferase (adenine-specific)